MRLHANELPVARARGCLAGRPEPLSRAASLELIAALAALYGVAPPDAAAARGSDEAIDLLVRSYCSAGSDAVLICPPTFGMYGVAARVQGAGVIEVPLRREADWSLDADRGTARSAPARTSSWCSCARRTIRPATCSPPRRFIAISRTSSQGARCWSSMRPTWSSPARAPLTAQLAVLSGPGAAAHALEGAWPGRRALRRACSRTPSSSRCCAR